MMDNMTRRIIMVAVALSAFAASAAHAKVQLWENGPYWAATNIGAEKPEDYGYYFWWGDTVGYKLVGGAWVASDGSSSNFSFDSSNTPTYGKSVDTLKSEGWVTSDGVLAPAHDAAHVHWGGDWRMPTKDEIDALNNNCDWTWTAQNGVNGYIVRGKNSYSSNSIFLPCAGFGDRTSLYSAGSHGNDWSSVPDSDGNLAWYLGFDSGYHGTYNGGRHYGQAVRPVQGFVLAGQLTPESTVLEKEVDFDQPTVVRFVMDAVATASASRYGYSCIDAGGRCKYSVDGVETDKFCPGLYTWAYNSTTNTESRSSEGVMYVPAGRHTLRWEWEIGNYWAYGDATAKIDIVNYSEEPLERKESLYDWGKTLAEDEVWIPDNLEYIYGKQSAQIAAYPTDYETRINRALTTLLRLGENETLRGLIGQFGFTLPDFYIYEPQGEFVGLENAPASTNVVDTALLQAIAAIDAALADIDAIPENWTGNILLDPGKYPAFSEAVYIDRAEVAAVRAVLRAFRAFAQLAQGYDFEADYLAVSNAWTTCATMENILASMPKAGLVRDSAKMSAAKEDFRTALNCLKKADAAIVARTDSLTHFLEYDQADARDIGEMRTLLDKAIASLDTPVEVDLTYALTQSPLNKSPLALDALPNGFVRQLYLGAIFAGGITRELLPSFEYGTEFGKDYDGNGDFLPVYFDTIPDPTLGGLVPDLTVEEMVKVYSGDKWWTAAGYMRDLPEMKLSAWRPLNISGTAAVDGVLSFSPNVDGYVCLYAESGGEMYLADDFDVADEEVCEYDIASGTKYRIAFYPYEDIEESLPLTIISIPEPFSDGGPYTEIVDGVEITFEVADGKAWIGTSDGDQGVPASTSGAVRIPALLGGCPVVGIHEYAFFRCKNITSLTFYGDEPVVEEDAFDKAAIGHVYVTHAANWPSPLPETWQGFPIGYVPSLNPALVVTPDKTSGDFSGATTLALSAPEGCMIYFTTDGSEPTKISSVYSESITLSETTTVKAFAVETATDDWGPVASITLTRVPSESQSIAVTPNVADGTRFVGSQYVSITAAPGNTIYYTTDGSDPMTSSTRREYTGQIYMSGTTTLKYYAVDLNGDWSPVQTATYTLRKSDGGPYSEYANGLYWKYRISSGVASLCCTTNYSYYNNGNMYVSSYTPTIPVSTQGVVEIPPELGGCLVVSISDRAFYQCASMTAVIIPNSVIQIADYAFSSCSGLTSVTIPDSVTSIGNSAFSNCSGLTSVTIPDGVTSIGTYAFSYCSGLTSVTIPDGVTSIGEYAFSSCSGLTSVTIPDGVTSIGTYAFAYCSGLMGVTIPDGVTSIGTYAFAYCSGLTSVTMPNSVTNVENAAFYGCSQLKDVVFEGNAPSIVPNGGYGSGSFANTSSLLCVYVHKDSTGWNVSIPGAWNGFPIKYIEDAAFTETANGLPWAYNRSASITRLVASAGDANISDLAKGEVVVPETIGGKPVTTIGKGLFQGASEVTGVTLPSTITAIEPSAFRECLRLESVELPDGLCEIGDNAFRECTSLKSIAIPATVTNIGYFAFRDCLRLETVTLLGEPPHQDLGVFMGVPAFTTISGRIGAATAIIYASITNATDEITVPEGWLDEIATMHDKPAGAASYQAAFEAKFGSDLAEALKQPTGKHDLKGNPLYVWQDYVAGTNPLDEEDTFTATIEFVDGVAHVRWSPELESDQAELREYKTYGAKTLDGNWVDVSGMTDEQRHVAGYQFFQVSVEMKKR